MAGATPSALLFGWDRLAGMWLRRVIAPKDATLLAGEPHEPEFCNAVPGPSPGAAAPFSPMHLPRGGGMRGKIAARARRAAKGGERMKKMWREGRQGALVVVRTSCPRCGWWRNGGVFYRDQARPRQDRTFCPMCGTTCLPVVAEMGSICVAEAALSAG